MIDRQLGNSAHDLHLSLLLLLVSNLLTARPLRLSSAVPQVVQSMSLSLSRSTFVSLTHAASARLDALLTRTLPMSSSSAEERRLSASPPLAVADARRKAVDERRDRLFNLSEDSLRRYLTVSRCSTVVGCDGACAPSRSRLTFEDFLTRRADAAGSSMSTGRCATYN